MRHLCPEMHTLGWKFNIFPGKVGKHLENYLFSFLFLENSTFIHVIIVVDECGKD